jgi:AcrR family transcriptional regulator
MTPALDTKTRILDTAEKLFGEKGFEATSLRDITTAAQVNLAAVNYHFQSKDSLIDAVIDRRMAPINRRRLEMLAAAGPSPSLEAIASAFIVPPLETDLTFVPLLVGRILLTPDKFVSHFRERVQSVAEPFFAAVSAALPHLPLAERIWRFHFMAGAMAQVLLFSRILPELTHGLCDPSDRKALAEKLIVFAVAGLRAPATGITTEKN